MAAQPPDDFEEEEGEGDLPYLNILEAGPVHVEAEDPKDLEYGLLQQIRDWSPVPLTEAFEIAVDVAVELLEFYRAIPVNEIDYIDLDARVQHYLDTNPLTWDFEEPRVRRAQQIHLAGDGDEPHMAAHIIRHLVNASLNFYVNQFQQGLHGAMENVRIVLESYQMEIRRILIHCLCASLQLEGDQQLGNHLANLKSIIKEVGSLVSAKTEGKVRDLVKGRQLPKEVEDILATVRSAVSKEVEVLISINMQQMKSFLNKERDGVDLTIVAFSPRLTKMERTSRETVDKFLTTFRSHPHTHRALVQLFGSESLVLEPEEPEVPAQLVTGDMLVRPACERDSGIGTAPPSKTRQYAYSEDDTPLAEDVRKKIGEMMLHFKDYDYFNTHYERGRLIGEGCYGKVFVARHSQAGESCAMKECKMIYEEKYADETTTSLSSKDKNKVLRFFRCCQEAKLQSDIFYHDNIVEPCGCWLQYDSVEGRKPMGTVCSSSEDSQGNKHDLDCDTYQDSEEENALIKVALYLYGSGKDNQKAVGLEEMSREVRDDLRKLGNLCIYIQMQQYDEDLQKWLKNPDRQPADKKAIVHQLLDAMGYVHSKDYSHADLHAGNILIKENNGGQGIKAAITDFGLGQLTKGHGKGKQIERDIMCFGWLVVEIFGIPKSKISSLNILIDEGSLEKARQLVQCYIDDKNIVEIVIGCLNHGGKPRVTLQDLKERYIEAVH